MATKAYMTARARTTPIKKCVYILLWNFAFTQIYSVWLLVLKLAPAEYARKASVQFQIEMRKMCGSRCQKKGTKNYNARASLCSTH